jgi:nucleotide-binding universal stress UspA family protein
MKILTALDGSEYSEAVFQQAVYLAKLYSADLDLVFVEDTRKTALPVFYSGTAYDISVERMYVPVDEGLKEFYAKMKEDLQRFGKNILEKYTKLSAKEGLTAESSQLEGFPAEQIIQHAHSCDFIVIGQKGEHGDYSRNLAGSTCEEVVHNAPRPVLLVPEVPKSISKVLFPYDGSQSSERAIQFFVNSTKNFSGEVVILSVCEEDNACLPAEVQFLNDHGIKNSLIEKKGSVLKHILESSKEEDVDLILLGRKGKKAVKELLLGSTTTNLMRKTTLPVLIVY